MQIEIPGVYGSGELWLDIMKIICGDTSGKNMIDLGCHRAPYTPLLGFKNRIYVDIQDRPLDYPEEQEYFVKDDIIHYMQELEPFNGTIIASDIIEHLIKDDGRMLYNMIFVKSKNFVLFTPLGPYMVDLGDITNPDSHRSGWLPEDFPELSCVIFPDFHPRLGIGAFFVFHRFSDTDEVIINKIKNKYVESKIS